MSVIPVKNSICNEMSGLDGRWDEAIADAKEKIRQLHLTIRVYKARKASGDRWPLKGNFKESAIVETQI